MKSLYRNKYLTVLKYFQMNFNQELSIPHICQFNSAVSIKLQFCVEISSLCKLYKYSRVYKTSIFKYTLSIFTYNTSYQLIVINSNPIVLTYSQPVI